MKKRLYSLFIAGYLGLSSILPVFSEEVKDLPIGVVLVKKVKEINPKSLEIKLNTSKKNEEETYEERVEKYSAKGVDIDLFMEYLTKSYPRNKALVAVTDLHYAIKDTCKHLEKAVDKQLEKYGLEFKISGGKEDNIISVSLIYKF